MASKVIAKTILRSSRFACSCTQQYTIYSRQPTTKIPTSLRWASTSPSSFLSLLESIEKINASEAKEDAYVNIQRTEDGRGWGLYARQEIPLGARVFRGRALETSQEKDSHSVQIDWTKHATMDLPAVLVNHSCHANLGIRENDLGAFDFFALQVIPVDSELLWDYETAEYKIKDFECSCGKPNCRGILKGFETHADLVLQLYGRNHVAPYLLRGHNHGDDA